MANQLVSSLGIVWLSGHIVLMGMLGACGRDTTDKRSETADDGLMFAPLAPPTQTPTPTAAAKPPVAYVTPAPAPALAPAPTPYPSDATSPEVIATAPGTGLKIILVCIYAEADGWNSIAADCDAEVERLRSAGFSVEVVTKVPTAEQAKGANIVWLSSHATAKEGAYCLIDEDGRPVAGLANLGKLSCPVVLNTCYAAQYIADGGKNCLATCSASQTIVPGDVIAQYFIEAMAICRVTALAKGESSVAGSCIVDQMILKHPSGVTYDYFATEAAAAAACKGKMFSKVVKNKSTNKWLCYQVVSVPDANQCTVTPSASDDLTVPVRN